MDFVSGALWHFTAYSLMSHQFISLFINTLNAKMISESMWLLHAQPLSPFLPIPFANTRTQPSCYESFHADPFFNHCSSCYPAFYGGGTPGILHTVQVWALKEKSHSRETEFVRGVEVQRASTHGTLHACWVQSSFLCEVPGVPTPKPTPTTSPRMPPRPGPGPLTTFLSCLLLWRTDCPFSGLRHKHPFPAR